MSINELSGKVLECAFKVHTALGPGLLESAYQACLEYELRANGLFVEKEKPVPLVYEGVKLDCGYRIDLLVERQFVFSLLFRNNDCLIRTENTGPFSGCIYKCGYRFSKF